MIKINIKLFVLVLFYIFFGANTGILAQKVITTKSGQKIVILPDKSWHIVEDTSGEYNPSLDDFVKPDKSKGILSAEQRQYVKNQLSIHQHAEAESRAMMEILSDEMSLLKLKLSKAKKNKNLPQRKWVESKIKQNKGFLKIHKKSYKEASKKIFLLNNILKTNDVKGYQKLIKEASSPSGDGKKSKVFDNRKTDKIPSKNMSSASRSPQNPKTTVNPHVNSRSAPPTCKFVFDGKDEISGKKRKELEPQFFFGYSNEKMKPFFKNDDMLTCTAAISKTGKDYYLILNITIKSKDAIRNYGSIKEGEHIKIDFVGAKNIYGTCNISSTGKIEPYTGYTKYRIVYEINRGDIKALKCEYIDKIGIFWTSGYEEYDIYNVDLLKNQLECF